MSATDDILRKVRALLELAARATPHEAAAAAGRADALLQKRRLTMADVGQVDEAATETIGEEAAPLWEGTRTSRVHTRLSAVLCEHYGCAAWRTRHQLGGITMGVNLRIAGLPSDVAIVRFMFAWLSLEIGRLAAKEKGSRVAFGHGCVTGIHEALVASRATVDAEHSSAHGASAAMVVASRHDAAKVWVETVHAPRHPPPAPSLSPGTAGAFLRGVKASEGISLGGHALPEGRRALPRGDS